MIFVDFCYVWAGVCDGWVGLGVGVGGSVLMKRTRAFFIWPILMIHDASSSSHPSSISHPHHLRSAYLLSISSSSSSTTTTTGRQAGQAGRQHPRSQPSRRAPSSRDLSKKENNNNNNNNRLPACPMLRRSLKALIIRLAA